MLASRYLAEPMRISSRGIALRGFQTATFLQDAVKDTAEPAAPKATTIRDAFDNAASKFTRRNAFRDPNGEIRWNFAEYSASVNAFANMLVEMKFKPGDSLAMCHRNSTEYVIAQLGSAKAGVNLVNLNPTTSGDELEAVLQAEKCRGLLFDNKGNGQIGMVQSIFPEMDAATGGYPLASARHPYTKFLIHSTFTKIPGAHRLRDVLVYNPVPNPLPGISVSAQTVAQTTYTDGKKVSSHTNSDILAAADEYTKAVGLNEDDVVCLAVPHYTGRGYAASVAIACSGGVTLSPPDSLGSALRALSVECNSIVASSSAVSGLASSEEIGRFKFNVNKALIVDANKADDAARNCSSKFGAKKAVAIKA